MSQAEVLLCTRDEYHAMRDSWSHSQLEVLRDSPTLFYGTYLADPLLYAKKHSKAFDWGDVVDAGLTHPEGVDAVMRIIPESVLNGDGDRKGAPWTQYKKEHAGLILLKEAECAEIMSAVRNCRAEPKAAMILDAPGTFQFGIKWCDDETGLWLRCLIDKTAYLPVGLFGVDIKTSRNNRLPGFSYDYYDYGYHRQAAHYLAGLVELGEEPDGWLNVAIGKPDPQDTIVYELKESAIQLGDQENRSLYRELAERLVTGDWKPRTYDRVHEIDVPKNKYPKQTEYHNVID